MKNQNELIAGMKGKSISSMTGPDEPKPEFDNRIVDGMLEKVGGMFNILKAYYTSYGAVLRSGEAETVIREQWVYELINANVNENMIVTGMRRAKTHASEDKWLRWPPISDFISWCYGLPTPDQAYREACANCSNLPEWQPSHPAVYVAGHSVTWFKLKTEIEKVTEPLFRSAYIAASKRVVDGEELTYTKPRAIANNPLTEAEIKAEQEKNHKIGRERIGELKNLVGFSKKKELDIPAPEHKPDFKKIAERKKSIQVLKDRIERGDL